MEGLDLFATKGIEYVLVIGYLLMLVACRRMVGPKQSSEPRVRPERAPEELQAFKLRKGLLYHQGHTWATPTGDGGMRVGLDDFGQKLLGTLTAVIPPPPGASLTQGEAGWRIRVADGSFPVISPLDGEVVAVNPAVIHRPELVNEDPYGEGWLLEVRPHSSAAAGRNLLSGPLAHAWMDEVAEKLERMLSLNGGSSSFEASSPEDGLARRLSGEAWQQTVRDFLLLEGFGAEAECAEPPAELV